MIVFLVISPRDPKIACELEKVRIMKILRAIKGNENRSVVLKYIKNLKPQSYYHAQ